MKDTPSDILCEYFDMIKYNRRRAVCVLYIASVCLQMHVPFVFHSYPWDFMDVSHSNILENFPNHPCLTVNTKKLIGRLKLLTGRIDIPVLEKSVYIMYRLKRCDNPMDIAMTVPDLQKRTVILSTVSCLLELPHFEICHYRFVQLLKITQNQLKEKSIFFEHESKDIESIITRWKTI